jgi:inorganic triphosphatase YgiF
VPVFETEFRARARLQRGDTELFLDFDEGEIRARGRSLPIREVELELVRGDAGVLYGIALELHEAVPVQPAAASKAQRGYALARGMRPAPQRAPRIVLPESASRGRAGHRARPASIRCSQPQPARDGAT